MLTMGWWFTLLIFLSLLFFGKTKNILSLIILLEAITLTTLLVAFFTLIFSSFSPLLMLMVFTFSVCEAALGLSLLITFFSVSGNDYISNFSANNWM